MAILMYIGTIRQTDAMANHRAQKGVRTRQALFRFINMYTPIKDDGFLNALSV